MCEQKEGKKMEKILEKKIVELRELDENLQTDVRREAALWA